MSLQEFDGLPKDLSRELLDAVSGGYIGNDPLSEENRERYLHAVWVLKHTNNDFAVSRNGLYMVTLSNEGTDYCEKIWDLVNPNSPWKDQFVNMPIN